MSKSTIILTIKLNCERDITEKHQHNLLMYSLASVTHRLREIYKNGGPESGNLHDTSGKPYGSFVMSKSDAGAHEKSQSCIRFAFARRHLTPANLFRRLIACWKGKLKAKLRDWCFSDYKWVTRAQVQRGICAVRWEYREYPLVQRVLASLQETIR